MTTTAEPTTGAADRWGMSDPVHVTWLKRVCLDASLIFLASALGLLLQPFLFAFLILSGDGYLTYPRWERLALPAARILALIGAVLLTAPEGNRLFATRERRIRSALLGLIVLGVIADVVDAFVLYRADMTGSGHCWWIATSLADILAVLFGLSYLRLKAMRLGLARLGNRLRACRVAWVVVALGALVFRVSVVIWPTPINAFEWGVVLPRVGWIGVAPWLAGLVIWLWGMKLLHAFRAALGLVLQGKCLHCRYELYGLPERRCPEVRPGVRRGHSR